MRESPEIKIRTNTMQRLGNVIWYVFNFFTSWPTMCWYDMTQQLTYSTVFLVLLVPSTRPRNFSRTRSHRILNVYNLDRFPSRFWEPIKQRVYIAIKPRLVCLSCPPLTPREKKMRSHDRSNYLPPAFGAVGVGGMRCPDADRLWLSIDLRGAPAAGCCGVDFSPCRSIMMRYLICMLSVQSTG